MHVPCAALHPLEKTGRWETDWHAREDMPEVGCRRFVFKRDASKPDGRRPSLYFTPGFRSSHHPCLLILHPMRPGCLCVPADLPIRGVSINKQRGGVLSRPASRHQATLK